MIWVRRILAIPVILLFVVVFLAAMVLTHISGTVGSAGFYNGQMDKADVYNWVHEELTTAMLSETGEESPTDFPLDAAGVRQDMVDVIEQAFPAAWLKSTFEGATGELVPYVVGDSDAFVVAVALKDRIDPLVEGINGVVDDHGDEIYSYVTEDLMVPSVTEELANGADLPYGITLSEQEISDIVTASMPQAQSEVLGWFKDMVATMGDYVKGDVDSLALTIDLTLVKSQAVTAANQLVDDKLRSSFDSIPPSCNELQFIAQLQTLPEGQMPACRPAGYTYEQFKDALEDRMGRTFAQAVDQEVAARIPGTYEFDDDQMREALGEDSADALDQVRDFIVEDQARVTDQNFRDLFDEEEDQTGMRAAEEEKDFDQARNAIHTVKMMQYVLWPASILLLVGIGFLLGRSWKGRLLWAVGTLFVTSLVFAVVLGVAGAVAPIPDRIVERPEGDEATQVGIVMADKGDEIVHNAINTMIWGLEVKFIISLVVSGAAIAGLIAWYFYDRKRRQGQALAEGGGLPEMPVDSGNPPSDPGEGGQPPVAPADSDTPPVNPAEPGGPPAQDR